MRFPGMQTFLSIVFKLQKDLPENCLFTPVCFWSDSSTPLD